MLRVYNCLTQDHNLLLVLLAVLLCLFASFTSLTLLQRSLAARRFRSLWLASAAGVTGVGIWATHFTAMLAFRPGPHMIVEPGRALASVVAAVLLAGAGWGIGFGGQQRRPIVGGTLVGIGLMLAHYLDMSNMASGGLILYDWDLVVLSIILGLSLCASASWFIWRNPMEQLPLRASVVLSLGILSLHFLGMSSATLLGGAPLDEASLTKDTVAAFVIAATLGILGVALAITLSDQRTARRSLRHRASLEGAMRALRLSEERYRLASGATKDVIWDWHQDQNVVEWGEAIGEQFGYPEARDGTALQWWVDRLHPDDRERMVDSFQEALAGSEISWHDDYRFRKADDAYADIHSRCQIIRDANGEPIRAVGAMLDVSERKRTEDSLRWAANHDPLTGLPNRKLFTERLRDALRDAGRKKKRVGLVVLDIDDFKAVNDTRGHAAGDALLVATAERLRAVAGLDVTVARLGGDEFGVIFPGLADTDVSGDTLTAKLKSLGEAFVVDGLGIQSSISAGGALWPRDGRDKGDLLKSADLALYSAKRQGRALTRMYSSEMRDVMEQRLTMLSHARSALEDDRIVPFYQPKVSLATDELVGFEALLRWHDHRNGLQPPSSIAAAFQDMTLAAQLTDRMFHRVVADVRRWLDSGTEFRRMAINGSAADFMNGDFADRFLKTLHEAGIPPSLFELEVTESVFVDRGLNRIDTILETLSQAGVTIALDDFGTGFASLSHLAEFPVDVLKIDQSFVRQLGNNDQQNAAIIRAVIGLGKSLGLTTVAEGVETIEQAEWLHAQGCNSGQGYLYSRAVAADRVPALIKQLAHRQATEKRLIVR